MEMFVILKRRGMLMVSVIFSTKKDDGLEELTDPGLLVWSDGELCTRLSQLRSEYCWEARVHSWEQLLNTLTSSDEMSLCFWSKTEGEISKWTHHMRAEADIQVGDRDPESKKRLMYRLGWLITRVQVYQYISPTSLHPLLKSNEQKTHIQTSAQRQENENVYRGRKA